MGKDIDRIHEKLKRVCSRKAFADMLEEEGRNIQILAPEWLESSLAK